MRTTYKRTLKLLSIPLLFLLLTSIDSYSKKITFYNKEVITSKRSKILLTNLSKKIYQDTSIKPGLKRITSAKNYQTICGGTLIKANYLIVPSCPYEANGSITIDLDSVKGGRAPYLFSFEGEKFSPICTFDNLSKETYRLRIKDQNGCLSSLITIQVDEKECDSLFHKSFAPTKGEVLTINYNKTENGRLKIINKEGDMVFSTSIMNQNFIQWNGKTEEGLYAETGLYIYQLKFNSGESLTGQIIVTP